MKAENGKQKTESPSPSIPSIKSTHTPGPWEIKRRARSGHVDLLMSGSFCIAHIGGRGPAWGNGDAEQDANAALIAAAPDLKDALETILASYKLASVDVNMARAALARAERSQP